MSIKVKAIERNVAFEKGKQKWAYVMQADLYSQLTQSKVIEEAAIGSVITAWATEGHSVAVPGLGSLRFGLDSQAVEDVNLVSTSLISRRNIIFSPSTDIKEQLAKASINITCYDRNGKIVKQVTSADKDDAEDKDNPGDKKTPGGSGGSTPGGSGSTSGGGSSSSAGSGNTEGDGNVVE